jgi:hypothetical protein
LLGKPTEFRQEFVRPSVAYVTNKEMPAAKKPFRFQRAAPGRSSGLGPTVTRESRLKGWQSASTFLMDRKGASAESCGTSSSGMETTASDLFDWCLEPCAAIRVFDGKSHPGQFASVPMSTPRCPHCDRPMSLAPRSLRPIFRDICAFECPPCYHTLLIKVPLDPTQHAGQISLQDNYPNKRP